MTLFNLIIISIIQGITEFLPISSSAHLILLPQAVGFDDQGQIIDVAVHLGTLIAVVVYFRGDVKNAFFGFLGLFKGQLHTRNAHLAMALIIAPIPAIIFGAILKLSGASDAMRDSIAIIGWTMLLFGIVLWWADSKMPMARQAETWTFKHAFVLGMWQALALIPGTSRSGITITGARLLGYKRIDAARLAMLMSIPTIVAAGGMETLDVIGQKSSVPLGEILLAILFSAVAAFLALTLMMRWLIRVSFTPYVIYRVILGLGLLGLAYF